MTNKERFEAQFSVGDFVRYKSESRRKEHHPNQEYRQITKITEERVIFDSGLNGLYSVLNESEWGLEKAPKGYNSINPRLILTIKTDVRDMELFDKGGVAYIKCGCFDGTMTEADEYVQKHKKNRNDYVNAIQNMKVISAHYGLLFEEEKPAFPIGSLIKGNISEELAVMNNSGKVSYIQSGKEYYGVTELNVAFKLVHNNAQEYLTGLINNDTSME